MKHLLSDFDLSTEELSEILKISEEIKRSPGKYRHTLDNKTLIMLFELPSLRTRISFEAGMTELGGHAIYYGVDPGGFSRSETLEDGVKVLSRYGSCIMARVLKQESMERIGAAATVPVINGMTEKYHPCQNITDLFTIQEKKGYLEGLRIAYIGDGGCNTAASTIIGCSSMGLNVNIVCPNEPEYCPSPEFLDKVKNNRGNVKVIHNPDTGVKDVDVIYTDVWISAGMEEEKEKRMKVFPPFQVNTRLLNQAKKDCIVMHCLPAHRGLEITNEIMDSPQSVVFDQAENRMHAQKGLLYWLLDK
jgi:ornithine carbamoyltransferase